MSAPRTALELPIRMGVAAAARRGLLYVDQATRKLALRTPWGVTLLGGAGGSGDLVSTNNLSDVANVRTALQNLGAPVPTLSSIGTWTSDEDGRHIRQASGGSTFSHKVQYITAPATPWKLAAEMRYVVGSDATCGMWARRSSNGKIVTYSFRADGTIHVYRWTDVSTFSADAASGAIPSIAGSRVLGMSSDGTTISFYHLTGVGMGGVATMPTASATETIATHLGGDPDQIGVYVDSYNAETQFTLQRMRSY